MHEELRAMLEDTYKFHPEFQVNQAKGEGILPPVRLVNLRIAYQFVYLLLALLLYTAEVNNVIQYVFLESGLPHQA